MQIAAGGNVGRYTMNNGKQKARENSTTCPGIDGDLVRGHLQHRSLAINLLLQCAYRQRAKGLRTMEAQTLRNDTPNEIFCATGELLQPVQSLDKFAAYLLTWWRDSTGNGYELYEFDSRLQLTKTANS
jgi:hypothetical protein